jgi:hypothetical protein
MVRITITEEQRQQLLAATGEVELCDASGRLLARATPVEPLPSEIEKLIPEGYELAGPWASDEEIERRIQSNEPGISTGELVRRLRGLT